MSGKEKEVVEEPKKAEIKSFEEIKKVLKQNKNAGGVGYVIAPELIKIAKDCGLLGYGEALTRWNETGSFSQSVIGKGEPIPNNFGLLIDWEGPALQYKGTNIAIGLEQTIRQIELAL